MACQECMNVQCIKCNMYSHLCIVFITLNDFRSNLQFCASTSSKTCPLACNAEGKKYQEKRRRWESRDLLVLHLDFQTRRGRLSAGFKHASVLYCAIAKPDRESPTSTPQNTGQTASSLQHLLDVNVHNPLVQK
jgi:hypothetical protein